MDPRVDNHRQADRDQALYLPAWYAVHTRSRHEQVVHDQLVAKGAETFLPTMEVWSRRTDRRLRIQVPMFPGYIFVRTTLHPELQLNILKTVGVVKLISFCGRPSPVAEHEISSLQILIDSGAPLSPVERFRVGDLVRIVAGPFKGVVGRLVGRRSTRRLVVAVETINRAVSVELEDHQVVKAEAL